MDKLHLGVLYGSRSCEHEVSIISALQLIKAIDRSKYEVTPIYITQQGEWYVGDALTDMKLYTDFDPYKAGLKRVSLDLTAGSGALIHYEQGKGLLRGIREDSVVRMENAVRREVEALCARRGVGFTLDAVDVKHPVLLDEGLQKRLCAGKKVICELAGREVCRQDIIRESIHETKQNTCKCFCRIHRVYFHLHTRVGTGRHRDGSSGSRRIFHRESENRRHDGSPWNG